jgi:hypothetical protein
MGAVCRPPSQVGYWSYRSAHAHTLRIIDDIVPPWTQSSNEVQ